jgi:isopropylmalate/homocitrate/citramalate synthase
MIIDESLSTKEKIKADLEELDLELGPGLKKRLNNIIKDVVGSKLAALDFETLFQKINKNQAITIHNKVKKVFGDLM